MLHKKLDRKLAYALTLLLITLIGVLMAGNKWLSVRRADLVLADEARQGGPITVGKVESIELSIGYREGENLPQTIHYPGAAFIKLHFRELDLAPGDHVTVSDAEGKETYTYPGSAYTTDEEGTGFWAMSVDGDTVVIKLHSAEHDNRRRSKYGVTIDKYTRGYSPETIQAAIRGIESICGSDDKQDVECYQSSHPTEYDRSDAVARMLLNNGSGLCTGWRVGPSDDIMFTNEHCITSQSDVNAAEAWFNYQNTSCGGSTGTTTKVTGNTLLVDNYNYDFALFTVNNASSIASFGYMELDARTPILNEEIYIAQHPGGVPKKFGIESDQNSGNICKIDDAIVDGRVTGSDTAYYCDTEGGSSGSPVLARSSHKVIGLHHYGGCLNSGVRIDLIYPYVEAYLGDTTPTPEPPTPTPEPPTPTSDPPTPTSEPPTPTPIPGQVFFDDFETDKGWTTDPGGSDTATTGMWERANPEETSYSSVIYQLGTAYSGSYDLVTEGAAGSSVGSYDIDGGDTTIRSPNITLPAGQDITLSFQYYLSHYNNGASDDYLRVKVVGSTTETVLEELGAADYDAAAWAEFSTSLNAFAGQTIYLLIEAADGGSGTLIEAAIDDVSITSSGTITPTPEPPTPTPEPPTPTPEPPTPTPEPPTPTPEPPTPTPGPGPVFFDDFETNQGWTTDPGGSDTATTGLWERANPEETSYSSVIYQLGTTYSGSYDLVTEGSAGSSVGSYDIDGGVTTIRSPDIVLPSGGSLTLSFQYYLAHYSNGGSDDFLRVKVVGSTTTTVFEELAAGDFDEAAWAEFSTSLDAYAGQTIYLLIEAADGGSGSLIEAAIDDVLIDQ